MGITARALTSAAFGALQHVFSHLARGLRFWNQKGVRLQGGHWSRRVSAFLHDLGFQQNEEGFVHPTVGQIRWPWNQHCGDFKQWLQRGCHLLREAWRRGRFESFLVCQRRDSQALRGAVACCEKRVTKAKFIYSDTSQSVRACMVGVAFSGAMYQKIRDDAVEQHCKLCGEAVVPSWYHIVWECRSATNRPTMPGEALSARLG